MRLTLVCLGVTLLDLELTDGAEVQTPDGNRPAVGFVQAELDPDR